VPHKIDWVGTALLSAGVTAIILMTTWGGTQYGWSSGPIVGLAAIGVALLIIFCIVETKVTEPIIPLDLFRNRTFSSASGVGFITGFVMFGAVIFLPLYLQAVHGATPTASGLELLPLVAGLMVTFIVSGRLVTRTGRYKIFPIVGSAVLTGGLVLLSRLGPHTSFPLASVYMFVVGLGVGLVMQVLVVVVQNSAPYSRLGVATSTATFFRTIGGAFGVSALGAVFDSRLLQNLSRHATKAQLSLLHGGSVTANPAQINQLPPAQRTVFIDAFSRGLQDVFLVAVPFAVLAFVLSFVMKEIPLRTTAQVAEPGGGAAPAPSVIG
jgi:MFS family permease